MKKNAGENAFNDNDSKKLETNNIFYFFWQEIAGKCVKNYRNCSAFAVCSMNISFNSVLNLDLREKSWNSHSVFLLKKSEWNTAYSFN